MRFTASQTTRIGKLASALLLGWLLFAPTTPAIADDDFLRVASPKAVPQFAERAAIALDPGASGMGINHYVSGPSPETFVTGPFVGTDINSVVGADTFYSRGLTGSRAVIACIEGGHIWSGHETLGHTLQIANHAKALNEVDRHATWVGMILAGRMGGDNPGAYQQGFAPDAQLYTGAVASQFNGARWARKFVFNYDSVFDQYRRAAESGLNAAGRTADVINSSWSESDANDFTGTGTTAIGLDALAGFNTRTLFVVAAGNEGAGPNVVHSPASGYNRLTVAALGPDPAYNTISSFSSGGPSNYSDPTNGVTVNARQVVDIAAPGQQLSAAYYGGTTGGNGTTDNPLMAGPGPTGPPNGPVGGPNFYSRGIQGTSFAAPTVAGGAALLYDAAYALLPNEIDARDARVVKAVLMNSADKTVGWNNGQAPHPNGQGGVRTSRGLDNNVGAGRMNLDSAFHQFLDGTTDVPGFAFGNQGTVKTVGWDVGRVTSGTTTDYFLDTPLLAGSSFTATLTWYRDRFLSSDDDVFDDSYDDLDLEFWRVVNGSPTQAISSSISDHNNTEHLSFPVPATGSYALRVRWFEEEFDTINDSNQELFALAWSVFNLGDFNRDGLLTSADIPAMLGALTNLEAYKTAQNISDAALLAIGDIDRDQLLTNADVQSLLNLISGGGSIAVPEPATLQLMAVATVGLIFLPSMRRRSSSNA